MSYRDARVKLLQDRRRRCRTLIAQVRALPWERVQQCDLCGKSEIAVIANRDRYGIPLQAGMCLHCGLVFLLDRLTREGYAEFYRHYYRPLLSRFWGRPINAESIQGGQSAYASQLVTSLQPWLNVVTASDPTLLDIGGSTGIVALEFANTFGYQATVLDPAPDELRVARAKGLDVVEGFIETYDQDEQQFDQFDLVLMCQTIEHLFALKGALRRIRKLVKENGYFVCDIVDFDEACYANGCVEGALQLDHCYYLSQEIALWMFPSLGWQVMHVDAAMRVGHVGYLLKPGKADSIGAPPDAITHLRHFQRLQTQWHLASQQTYGILHWMRKRAYYIKKNLQKLWNR